ncbi:MAG: tRNA-dihydrouridine(20/20a) synthase [Gammaproteobacteria bacterium]|nr:tRNA dihydrouridine(20/20a) synthase DusA [SAR86 cluster bacterium]GIT61973.1 MAG: tRNA-dihydrouridine(20/20a) synthase [Gammaproteobacteria bacterium]
MIHRFCVAPMMDRTDRHERFFLRSLSKKAYLYTEMINANAVLFGDQNELLKFNECEHPLAIQLGGNDPIKLSEAATISESYGYDEINLNIGCPSNKVQSGNFGAILMNKPNLVAKCVKAIKNKVNIPVSVKCRIGVDDMDEEKDLNTFIKKVSDSGCKIFIVHARKAWLKGLSPRENRNIPPLNYERVYKLKDEFPHLEIIINGGLENIEDSKNHLTKVDGVMMGRKAYENPFQLTKVDHLFYGMPFLSKTRKEVLLRMIPYIIQQHKAGIKINLISRHFMGLTKGTRFAKQIRANLTNLNALKEPEKKLTQIANQLG